MNCAGDAIPWPGVPVDTMSSSRSLLLVRRLGKRAEHVDCVQQSTHEERNESGSPRWEWNQMDRFSCNTPATTAEEARFADALIAHVLRTRTPQGTSRKAVVA